MANTNPRYPVLARDRAGSEFQLSDAQATGFAQAYVTNEDGNELLVPLAGVGFTARIRVQDGSAPLLRPVGAP